MTGRAELPKLLTMDELAESLGVTRRMSAGWWLRRGCHVKVGRFIRVDPAEIATWLDSNPVAGSRGFSRSAGTDEWRATNWGASDSAAGRHACPTVS